MARTGGWGRPTVRLQRSWFEGPVDSGLAQLLAALLLLVAPAHGQPVAEFYAGRQMTMIVGFNPGGGFETYARAVSRHMGRHIAGNPSLVIRHMPGAGSIIAANHLYNTAPKDGSEIGLVSDTVAIDALLGTLRTQFDAHRFVWLGSASRSIYVCAAWHTSSARTAADLREREVVVGITGTGTSSFPIAMRSVLGLKLRIVGGYAGTAGLMLALERGEIEAMCGPIYDAIRTQRAEWLRTGRVRWLIQLGLERVPELGDTPWAMELARSDDDRRLLALIVGTTIMGRPFVAPPGIPEDRKAALRTAFMATMRDPQFLAEAERLQIEVSPIDGEAIARYVSQAYATPPAIIERARAILAPN